MRAAPSSEDSPLGLAQAPDIQRHNAVLTPKPLVADHVEERPTIATAMVPAGQERRFVRIEEAAVAGMHRLAIGKRRALEGPAAPCAC